MNLDLSEVYNLLDLPDPALLNRVTARVDWAVEKLHQADIVIAAPVLNFDLKGRTAGYAYKQDNRVRLNLELLNRNTEDFIKNVIPHEIAHLAAFKYFPDDRPHGRAWQLIMEGVLNLPAERCHQFDTEGFVYACACAEGCKVGPIVHRRIQENYKSYRCRVCRLSLVQLREDNV